jgi:hypothetical protein
MPSHADSFRTDNLDIAAYIAAKTGRRWAEARRQGRMYFYFEDGDDARRFRDEYLNGGTVVAQEFIYWRGKGNEIIHANKE